MSELTNNSRPFISADAWSWWEARRVRYNLALAAAGWAAFGVLLIVLYVFDELYMPTIRSGIASVLALGILFLIVMGVANILYLLGAASESIIRPKDLPSFRKRAHAMGFWGSVALPFAFPALVFALLLGGS